MDLHIFTSLLISFALGLAVYAIGHCILCFLPIVQGFEAFFRKLTVGIFFMVTLYSVIKTGGQTILLGGMIPFGLAGVTLRKQLKWQWHSPKLALPEMVVFGGVLILLTLLNYSQAASFSGTIYDLNQDYSFYARIAHQIGTSGVEGLGYDFANPEFSSPTIYHYAELWLVALLSNATGLTAFSSLYLVAYPILGSIAVVGMGAIAEKAVGLKHWKAAQASLVILLLPILYLQYYLFDHTVVFTTLGYGSLLIEKLYPVIISLCMVCLVRGGYKVVVLLILVFLNSIPVAPVFAGITLGLAFELLVRQKRDTEMGFMLLAVCLSVAYFALFYAHTTISNPYVRDSFTLMEAMRQAMHQYGRTSVVQYLTLPLLDLLVNTLPTILLIALLGTKLQSIAIVLKQNATLAIITLTAAIGYSTIWYLRDSIQLYYSIAYPLFLIMNGFVIIYSLTHGTLRAKAASVVLLLIYLMIILGRDNAPMEKLDNWFYNEIISSVKADKKEPRFAWVEFKELRGAPSPLLRDVNYRKPLYPIGRAIDEYSPVRLDPYYVEYDRADVGDASVISSIENNSFFRFVEKNGLQNNIREAQTRYIIENQIRYLIIPRGVDWIRGRGLKVKRVIESMSESYSFYILDL